MTHHIDLDALVLKHGGHPNPDDGMCMLEAVAYFAHEKHSDHPKCTSPVIGAFLRTWNDQLDDEGRQRLKRLIPLVVGTNTGKADDQTRAWLVTDWMVRTYLPAWLDLGGMGEQATAVRALAPIVNPEAWTQGKKAVGDAQRAAAAAWAAARAAAWAAARDAAWAAARDAAWAAAGDAAWAAARDAARDAAWAAAWAAARDAAWAAAGDAAWAAAGAAAGDAARAAARDAAGAAARAAAWAAAGDAARAAAGAAARAALRPTVEGLQASALDLVEQLCAVGKVPA